MNDLLAKIDRSLTFKQSLLLIPFVLALHNAEEALTMPRWVMENFAFIQSNIPFNIALHFTPAQLLTSLAIATVIPFVVTVICVNGERRSAKFFLLLLLQMIVLLNVFVPHILTSLRMHQYNPGVVTAVCCNLPFSLYLFRRAYREQYLSRRDFMTLGVLAAVVYLPVAATIHFAGELIAKWW